ncbi:MAG: hypothetical protein ABSC77_06905 [Terracidiphilus sp.]|jgi:hypothetical protein
MKQRALLAILICATALTVFPDQPRANAQITLTLWGYKAGSASATRQPRSLNGGQFSNLSGPNPNNDITCATSLSGSTATQKLECISTIWQSSAPSQPTYVLAYVNISGGGYGNINVVAPLPASIQVPNVNIANPAIVVNAYYYPSGPCPPNQTCSSAAVFDEYDELQGALLDDTFVSVAVPSDPALNASYTTQGNIYGEVDTTKYGVQISADQPPTVYPTTNPPTPSKEIFDKWVIGQGGNHGANANQLIVNAQTTNYSIAMYHLACMSGSTWSSTATISQCAPIVCPKGENWSAEYNQCIPTCPGEELWNVTTKKCVKIGNPPGEHCNMKCPAGTTCFAVAFECDCICGNLNQNTGWHTSMQK